MVRSLFSKVADLHGSILGRFVGNHKNKVIIQKENGQCFLEKESNLEEPSQEYHYKATDGEFRALRALANGNLKINWDFIVTENKWGDLSFEDCGDFLLVSAHNSDDSSNKMGSIKLNNMNEVMDLFEKFSAVDMNDEED